MTNEKSRLRPAFPYDVVLRTAPQPDTGSYCCTDHELPTAFPNPNGGRQRVHEEKYFINLLMSLIRVYLRLSAAK